MNRIGLRELNAYGSSIIHFPNFKKHFKDRAQKLYVINLLNEEIYYYKERPLRWYGMGFTKQDLGKSFYGDRPFKRFHTQVRQWVFGAPPLHDLSLLQTEEQIIKEFAAGYFLPLKENSGWLGNQSFMEDLIRFFASIPQDGHLYIHCFHGRGRTTTFLVLYDIFRNSKKVPLKDIILRHHCLGREDLENTKMLPTGTWTQEALNARADLIRRFYDYMNDPKGYGHQPWNQWNRMKGFQEKQITIHKSGRKSTPWTDL
jgi:hypothetical protein